MLRIVVPILFILISCNPAKNGAVNGIEFDAYHYTIEKKVNVQNGAVVSAHALCSKIGVEILKAGGNAFDAAIATQLALAVVYPNAGNLGGGGFMVAHLNNGKSLALDYREMAPGQASRDMYLDKEGNAATDKSQNGHLSAGVPGTVAGLFAAHQYGKLPFSTLIQPAIDLAEKGFVISAREANSFNSIQSDLKKFNSVQPVFVKASGWKEGDTLVQADLANTLKRIKEKGAAGFYEGETARLLVEEMKRGGGIINNEDLKNYKAKFREPHSFTYKHYQIIGMPMPSSGAVLLHQMMKMIEARNIASMGFETVRSVQLMTEAERRAYADRSEYMGDADFYKVPVDAITNEKYLVDRMKDYDSLRAGNSQDTKPGKALGHESEETTHLSVIDKEGNAVSVTTTLNDSYGSKTVIGGAGFFINDEMDDFSIKPGVPNLYGAIGGEANSILPGKRMLSSMAPTIVLKDGQPYLVVGTPGGTTIPTSVFQSIINIIEFGMSAEDAVYKPKFHHQWLPDSIDIEAGFPQNVRDGLEKMGYHLREREEIGRTELIKVSYAGEGKKQRSFEAVADIRGEDAAAGW